jgi:hypothetical protein
MMLSNGLASDDDAKAFKYASEAATNGLPYHMNVDAYSRTPGSRQPSPSEEDLTKNHSPGLPISHSGPIKPGDGMGLPPNNSHNTMVGSLTGPIQGSGMSNGIGPMSGLVNGGGPPGKCIQFFLSQIYSNQIVNPLLRENRNVNASLILCKGLGLSSSGTVDGHNNHYEPVMMEQPGVHFDSSYSVLSTMDTQSSGMLQQNFDAHVCFTFHSSLSSFFPLRGACKASQT